MASVKDQVDAVLHKYFIVWSAAKPFTSNWSGPCITLDGSGGDIISFSRLGFWDCNGPERHVDMTRLYNDIKAIDSERQVHIDNQHAQSVLARSLDDDIDNHMKHGCAQVREENKRLTHELKLVRAEVEKYKKTAEYFAAEHAKAIELQKSLFTEMLCKQK
jgi:hypothetical protein